MHTSFFLLGTLLLLIWNAQAGFPSKEEEDLDRERHRQWKQSDDAPPDLGTTSSGEKHGGSNLRPTLPTRPPVSDDHISEDGTVPLLIKYKNNAGRSNIAKYGRNGKIKLSVDRYNVAAIDSARKNIEALRNDPNIEKVEFDQKMYPASLRRSKPLGDSFTRRRRLYESMPYGLAMVQADEVPMGPNTVKICVVDTGYGDGHPDLPTRIGHGVAGWDDGTTNPWYLDTRSHGTHCAGTIGAIGSNNEGVLGVIEDPSKFSFYITKGLNQNDGSGSWSNIAASVQKCVENGARIISMSLQGGGGDILGGVLESAYRDDNVLIVAAAGNWGSSAYSYPASYPSVMSVAAVDSSEVHASFSQINNQVEIAAPGVGVLSTTTYNSGQDFSYASWEGTSMATPHVAGVAAKLLSYFPQCTNYQIRNVLNMSAKDKGASGCDNSYGHGIVQALDAKLFLDTYGCDAFGTTSDSGTGGCSQSSNIPSLTPPPTPAPSPEDADFHEQYGAPGCLTTGSRCDSTTLLYGRGSMSGGAEPNQPNTLFGTCSDGNFGTYYNNECIEKLVIQSTDSQVMQEGKLVTFQATVFVWGAGDYVDLYYAADASNPVWQSLGEFAAEGTNHPEGIQIFTAQYELPIGSLQAVRANLRWWGAPPSDSCGGGSDGWGEADDLVFAVAACSTSSDCPSQESCLNGACVATPFPTTSPTSTPSLMPSKSSPSVGTPTWEVVSFDSFETNYGSWTDGGSDATRVSEGASDGSISVRLRDDTSTSRITSSSNLVVGQYDELRVAFSFIAASMETDEALFLQISTDGGSSFSTIRTWRRGGAAPEIDFSNGIRYNEEVIIDKDEVAFTDTTRLRFQLDASSNGDNVYLDEVEVAASSLPPSPAPSPLPAASYDDNLFAPACVSNGIGCDTVDLIFGRGASMGPSGEEPNHPNTIGGSCADGTDGGNNYLDWESIERITVQSVEGNTMQGGSEVVIEAEVWAWSNGEQDAADFYYTENAEASSINWVYLGTIVPPGGGLQVLSQQYSLPEVVGMQAVRVNFRWQENASSCTGGEYADTDDLVFAVA